MEERSLFKLALIVSLTGLLLLIFISDKIEIEEYDIKDINKKLVNKQIKVSGTIERVTETPGLVIFDIKDKTGTITAIAFKESFINLTKNRHVEIEGQVITYKDKLEIQVDQILT
ncbi:MAG: OB-fold nucleic acid binding domain-containing protein [Candidatus Woesearchaeota archaeon]